MYYYLESEGFTPELISDFNAVYSHMEEALAEDGWTWPTTAEEWKDLSKLILYELQDLKGWANLVIPLSEIESALKKYRDGSYWGAAFDISMAAATFVPVGKIGKTTKFFAKKLTRSSGILKIFRSVKALGNAKVSRGFKASIFNEYKNPHIFRVDPSAGHVGHPTFDFLVSAEGGEWEFLRTVYKKAFQEGKLANLPTYGAEKSLIIRGKLVKFKAANVTSQNRIQISTIWTP